MRSFASKISKTKFTYNNSKIASVRPTTTRRIANSQADKNSSQCIFHVLSYFTDRIAVLDSMVQFRSLFSKANEFIMCSMHSTYAQCSCYGSTTYTIDEAFGFLKHSILLALASD